MLERFTKSVKRFSDGLRDKTKSIERYPILLDWIMLYGECHSFEMAPGGKLLQQISDGAERRDQRA